MVQTRRTPWDSGLTLTRMQDYGTYLRGPFGRGWLTLLQTPEGPTTHALFFDSHSDRRGLNKVRVPLALASRRFCPFTSEVFVSGNWGRWPLVFERLGSDVIVRVKYRQAIAPGRVEDLGHRPY